jgi:hypothetical protein
MLNILFPALVSEKIASCLEKFILWGFVYIKLSISRLKFCILFWQALQGRHL